MKGIGYIIDDSGKRKAVVVDLDEHGDLWEELYDVLLAERRSDEPRETFTNVKKKLFDPVE